MDNQRPKPKNRSPIEVIRHPAVRDGCTKIIFGTRYKCSSCPDWDYCTTCHQNAPEIHPMHQFSVYSELRITQRAIKSDLLPETEVHPNSEMSYAEFVRRYVTVASRDQLGKSRVFEYTPLNDQNSFRLLALMPGLASQMIRCKTVHVTLDDNLEFEALSYAWGTDKEVREIIMEDLRFLVAPNLFAALQRLRLTTAIRYLWVDALCIDQIDSAEKEIQVKHMKAIFSKAITVIFWLGEASEDSDLAMDLICGAPQDEGSMLALGRLFERPCWYRVWCLQEVSVAKLSPAVMCGHRSATWEEFEKAQRHFNRPPTVYPSPSKAFYKRRATVGFGAYAATRKLFQRKSPDLTLKSLLRNSQLLLATHPRDHVYGLLGLANDASQFKVDYTQSAATVFQRAAEHVINSQCDLNILFSLTNSNSSRFSQPLPSWVPDWTIDLNERPPIIQSKWLYQASGNYGAKVEFNADTIDAMGLLVDRVDWIISPILFTSDLSNLMETVENLEQMVRRWIYEEVSKPPDDIRMEQVLQLEPDPRSSDAFWRTLICNQMFKHDSRTDSDRLLPGYFIKPASDFANIYEILRHGHDCSPRPLSSDFLSFEHTTPRLRGPMSRVPDDFMPDLPIADRIEKYICPLKCALMILSRRQFFITENGRIGVAEQGVQKNDLVTVLYGADMPILLRSRDSVVSENGERRSEPLQLIGQAYVHGIMDGEAVATSADNKDCAYRYRFTIR